MIELTFRTNLDKYSFLNKSVALILGSPIPRKGEMIKINKGYDVPFDELEVVAVKYHYHYNRINEVEKIEVFIELHYSELQRKEAKAYNIEIF